jgi:hypothetical protein
MSLIPLRAKASSVILEGYQSNYEPSKRVYVLHYSLHHFGFHSRASFCASAICAEALASATIPP